MKKTSAIILCCVAGLAGVVVGAWGTFHFAFSMADTTVLTRAEADLAMNTRLLKLIQSGENSRATESLQMQLDGALITIDAFAAQGRQLSPETYGRLRRVREMRDGSGYRPSDAGVASAVERALMLGEKVHP